MAHRLAIIFCAVILLWIPSFVHAFAVAPATLDLSGSRGTSVTGTVAVINNSDAEQTYYLGTLKFAPDETSGGPEFIAYETDHSGMPEWIAFPVTSVSIPSQTKVDVPFTVMVPKDVPSGTYYAAVTVSLTPSEIVASNGATIEAKLAVLVFLTVGGETIEKLALLDFVTPGNADGPLFSNHEVSYAYRLQNQGNVAVVPSARITVRDVFGRKILASDANPSGGRVLPESTRAFYGEIVPAAEDFFTVARQQASSFAIGPVTATLAVTYGSETLSSSISYWAFPWQLLVCFAVLVVLMKLVWNGLTRKKTK